MRRSRLTLLLLVAAGVLTAIAVLRGGEYDEFYTVFLLAGDPRPVWPTRPFTPPQVRADFIGKAGFANIARNLRRGDVHPPFYFWLAKLWRTAFGPSLLALRLLSVLCALIALLLLARIAVALGIDPPSALLLTLGCYGFAYSSIVARDFALTTALILGALLTLLRGAPTTRSDFGAGALLASACCTNDLAVFTAVGLWLWLASQSRSRLWPVSFGALPLVPLWGWFYLAQRNSRQGQFHHFTITRASAALLRDQAAAILGGLPDYAPRALMLPAAAALGGFLLLLVIIALRARLAVRAKTLLLAGAVAPPLGLLMLGAAFNTMPFEIRYFWLGLPFIGLLLAAGLAPYPRLRFMLLALDFVALIGLAVAPQTMQPTARLALRTGRMGAPTLIIIPFGNDGVGIPGPFINAAPSSATILVARQANAALLARARAYPRIAVPDLTPDYASRILRPHLLDLFQSSLCWVEAPGPHRVTIFLNHCQVSHG